MSELVPQQSGMLMSGGNTSSTFMSSSSSSFSSSSSSSTSGSKVTQQASSTKVQKSSSSMSSTSSTSASSSVSIKSSGTTYSDRIANDMGILDVSKEMERLKLKMGEEMANIHQGMFQLMPSPSPLEGPLMLTAGTHPLAVGELVKLDGDAIRACIDQAHNDRVKLNFDVNEFESESINVKTVGNRIEVHATKKAKKGDEERSEEYSRVYELPTSGTVDAGVVTSSIYKDGVLTVELPVSAALDASTPAQQ